MTPASPNFFLSHFFGFETSAINKVICIFVLCFLQQYFQKSQIFHRNNQKFSKNQIDSAHSFDNGDEFQQLCRFALLLFVFCAAELTAFWFLSSFFKSLSSATPATRFRPLKFPLKFLHVSTMSNTCFFLVHMLLLSLNLNTVYKQYPTWYEK